MIGPRDYHTKSEMISFLYMESKIWNKWTYLWNRNRLTDIENKIMVTKGEREGMGEGYISSLGLADTNYYI